MSLYIFRLLTTKVFCQQYHIGPCRVARHGKISPLFLTSSLTTTAASDITVPLLCSGYYCTAIQTFVKATHWFVNSKDNVFSWSTRWRRWLRHSGTTRKVAGSIIDDVRPQYGTTFYSASNRDEY